MPAGSIERVQTFVVDVETGLRQLDTYFRELRELKFSEEVVGRRSENEDPSFEQQRQQYLKENRSNQVRADDMYQSVNTMLRLITGIVEVEEVRKRLTEAKVALNRVGETYASMADVNTSVQIIGENEEMAPKLAEAIEVTSREYARAVQYATSLVPADYSPNNSYRLPSILLS